MMQRIVSVAVCVGAVIVITHSTVRSGVAAKKWASASAMAASQGATAFVDRPIQTDNETLAPLASADRAVVFVLSPECRVCSANMANWTDMILDLTRQQVPIYAIAPADSEGLEEFWAGFVGSIPVVRVDVPEIAAALNVDATPATLVVRGGRVRAVAFGVLSEATRQQILEATRR